MDNKKRLKRKVNAKLKTVLLMLLAIMFVISSLMTESIRCFSLALRTAKSTAIMQK
jgi:hypothetical protein